MPKSLRGGGTYKFDITSDTTVTVTFTQKTVDPQTYTITVNKTPEEGGVVEFSQTGPYTSGTTVQVTVTANKGYAVDSVTVDGADQQLTEGKFSLQITKDVTVAVNFVEVTAKVTLITGTGAHLSLEPEITPDSDGSYSYRVGTQLTVNLSFDAGYELLEFFVGDEKITQTENNKYTFELVEDVEIELNATRPFTQELLAQLQGNVAFEGTFVLTSEDEYVEDSTSNLFTAFYPATNSVWQKETQGTTVTTEYLFVKTADGNTGLATHDIFTGKAELFPLTDDYQQPIPFTQFQNAFDGLTAEDFRYVDGVWQIVDIDQQTAVVESITGYSFDIIRLDIVLRDGKLTVEIEGESEIDWTPVQIAIVLQANGQAPAIPAEYLADYTISTDVQPLAEALNASAAAHSYTVAVSSVSGYNEVSYNNYRTENVIYSDEEYDEGGYIVRPDGSVWSYYMSYDGEIRLDEKVGGTFEEYVASFDLGGVFPGMFTVDEEGNFVLRSFDVNGPYGEYLAAFAALSFAHGSESDQAGYAVNIQISVEGGKIGKVAYYYIEYIYDDIVYDEGGVVYEFSKYDSTEIPVQIDQSVVNGTMPGELVGHWVNDDEGIDVYIELDTVAVGDEYDTTDEITANADGTYTATFGNDNYTISKDGDKLVLIDPEGKQHQLRFKPCDWEYFLGEFSGSAVDEDHNSHKVTVKVEINRVTILVDDRVYATINEDDLNYYEEDNQIVGWIDYERFEMYVMDVNYNVFACMTDFVQAVVYRSSVKVDLTPYVGLYENKDEGYKVEITAEGLTLWLPDMSTANKATDVFVAEYESDRGGTAMQITFMVENHLFTLDVFSHDKMALIDTTDDYEGCMLIRQGFVASYEDFVGDYKQVDNPANSLKIEQGKITVVLDGKTYVYTEFVYYDVEYIYPRFVITDENGDEWTLSQNGLIPGFFNFYNFPELTTDVFFVREGFVMDLAEYKGTYNGVGTDNANYQLVINDHDWTLSKDGKSLELSRLMYNKFVSTGGTYFFSFDFLIDGEGYSFQPGLTENGKVYSMYIAPDKYEGDRREPLAELFLDRYTDLESGAELAGTYVGSGYELTVTDIGINVKTTGNATAATQVAFGKNYNYSTQKWYYVCYFNFDGHDFSMQFVDDKAAAVMVQQGVGDVAEKVYFVISSTYEHTADYDDYEGYYEDENGTYALKITSTAVTLSKEGKACNVVVLYYGAEGGLAFTADGTYCRLIAQSQNGKLALLLFEDQLRTILLPTGEPVTDFTKYMGTYNGTQNETSYRVIVEDSAIRFFINGEEVTVTSVRLAPDQFNQMVFTFVADGVTYTFEDYGMESMLLRTSDNKVNVMLRLDKGCEWSNYLGKWTATREGTIYELEFTEDDVIYTVNGVKQESSFNWLSDDKTFRITVNGVIYTAELYEGKISFFDGKQFSIELDKVAQPQPQECAWTDYIGVWSAEDLYYYSITITESGIHVTYRGRGEENADESVDYFVEASMVTYTEGESFTWTYDGLEWILEIYGEDEIGFYDTAEQTDIYVNLSKEA